MANGDTVRILVVDDSEPWRRQVCSMLQTRPEFRVVAEVADGLEAANRIRQFTPDARVVFLTQNSDKDVIQAALSTGAQGYVQKANAWAELFTAIEGVPQERNL